MDLIWPEGECFGGEGNKNFLCVVPSFEGFVCFWAVRMER